ncbi:aminotransferase class IV [Psychrobacter sp. DM4]|uniref:aminotransferase class IV n=1 Tax=Psychrobacter sp. DM4 TaxID=3440637 RepID=UPI003F50393F
MNVQSNAWVRLTIQDDVIRTEDITPDNRGMAYGDGFFTTMGVMDGAILWQNYHVARLISHSAALELSVNAQTLIVELQPFAQRLNQGILKLIITRTPQHIRGYGYTPDSLGQTCAIWLKSSALPIAPLDYLSLLDGRAIFQQPAKRAICLSAQLACLPPPLAGLKTLNRLDSVLASGELQRLQEGLQERLQTRKQAQTPNVDNQWGEGLVRDMRGQWVEGTMSNVFYQLIDAGDKVKMSGDPVANIAYSIDNLTSGQWYTPSMMHSGVAGIMRQVIIDALATTGKPVIIRPLLDEDLPQLNQLFFCNAVRGVMPVSDLTLLTGEVVALSL